MSNPIGDRNLLAGIIAVQKKFISRAALVAAMRAWTQAKDKGLAQILREQKALTENQHALLEEAVHTELAQHDHDALQALAALTSANALKPDLAAIADADLQASVAKIGTAPPEPVVLAEVAPVDAPKKKPVAKPKAAPPAAPAKKPAASRRSLGLWLGLAFVAATFCIASLGGAAILGYVMMRDRPIAKNPDNPPIAKDGDANKDKDKNPAKDKKKDDPLDPDDPPEAPVVDRKPIEIVGEANWSVEGDQLVVHNPSNKRAHLYFGSKAWTDYDFSFETQSTAQSSGPLAQFRAADSQHHYSLSLGAFLRTKHTLARVEKGQVAYDLPHFETPYSFDQWYAVRIEVRGERVRCFVDGKEVFDYKNKAHARGMVGLGATGSAKVRWKNIFVTSPEGDVLWTGPPELGDTRPAPASEFVSLFNGKDLTGWKRHALSPGEWRVQDGILSGAPWPRKVGIHYLQTENPQPKDFHLRVEMRVLNAGNAAVYFRCLKQDAVRGYSTMVYRDGGTPPSNNIGSIHFAPPGQGPAGAIPGGKMVNVAANEWFTLEIIAQGKRLIAKVNGQTTVDGIDSTFSEAGEIVLAQMGPNRVEFRKIEIKELKVAPEVLAMQKDFVPLFNGKDLTGWKNHKLFPGEWRVDNGVLIGFPSPDKGTRYLQTDKPQPKDFHLRMEARVGAPGGGGVWFRCPPDDNPLGYFNRFRPAPKATGNVYISSLAWSTVPGQITAVGGMLAKAPFDQWFKLEIIADGNHLVIIADGRKMIDTFNDKHNRAGDILLAQVDSAKIEFRKIEIKELVKAPPLPVAADKDFIPLFNGKDLFGWKKDPIFAGDWRVENGILIGSAGPRNRGRIESERIQPRDFHLRVEARLAKGNSSGNVFFRSAQAGKANYESSFGLNAGGLMYQWPGVAFRTFPRNAIVPAFQPQPGEWFTLELIARGDNLITKIDGVEHVNVRDAGLIAAGPLGLNVYSQSDIEIRKFEIKPLDGAVVANPPAADGFVSLFNGKDLTGWKANRPLGNWRVVNGILTGSTDGAGQGYLFTDRGNYQDFHLRARVRCTGDSGSIVARAGLNYFGYDAQIHFQRRTGVLYVNSPKGARTGVGKILTLPADEWMDLEFIAVANRLTIKVNGQETTNFLDPKSEFPTGHIALRHHRNSVIEVQTIEIKELNNDAPPVVVAGDFTPLFNGKDLTGWKADQQLPGKWSVEEGAIVGLGGKGNHGMLWTQRNIAQDFHLRFEAKISDQGSAYVRFRCPPNSIVGNELVINSTLQIVPRTGTLKAVIPGRSIDLITMKQSLVPAEQWAAYEIIAQGKRLIVKVDGKVIADVMDNLQGPAPGHIGLASANGTISFRKIALKELPGGIVVPPPPAGLGDAQPFAADPAFVPLFNGRDLTGLKMTERQQRDWEVVNGVLTASGLSVKTLYTPRDDYGDFHLRAEMRISDDGSGSLSFRYPFLPAEIDKGRPGGNHVRLSGKVNDFFAKTGGIMIYEKVGLRNLVAKEALMQPGKWFNLEIIAEGNLLTTKVNGQQAVQFDNPKTHLAGGRIVLRADATIRPTTLEVRKLEIKEFKKVAAPPQPPPEGPLEAFVPLFNGKDLDGWRVEGNAGFKVENGEIVGMGPNTALISKRADYRGVIVKVRLAASADVEAYFAFRQNTEDGKLKGLTSRITGDGVGVKLGYVGTDGNKLESGNQQLRLRPGEFGDVEFHVRHDLMKVLGNGKHVGGLGYAPDRYPPGAIGLHVVKGSVRIEKIEISAEAPIGQVPVNPPPAAADFAPLFNGKDLDGWKSNRVVGWRVFNGLLVGVGNDIGELYTQRSDYGDFHLRVEGRINASANSMIMFRYPFGADELARSTMGGYAAVITGREADAQKTGSLHFFDGAAPRSFPARVQLIQPGQWFTLDAIAVGNQVTIRVNGVTTATYKNPKDTFLGGRIVLGFGDTNKKTLIEYRKIEIKEFKAVAAPPPPAVAILRDWTPLYNGKNLAGWRDDGGKGTWHVTPDGTLVGNAPNAWILTERKDLKNFNVKIQLSADEDVEAFLAMRQNAAPEGKWLGLTSRIFFDGVKVRVGLAGADGSKVEKGERQLQVKPGTPFNLEFQVRGDNMKVLANGTVTANMAYPADKHPPGAFGLLVSKGCVRITKIELAEEVTRAAAKFVPVGEPVPLFNGKDLTGWQALDDAKGKWRVENGILVGDGFAPGVLHTTKADFKDYHLRMEARFTVTPNGAGQIVVRSADGVTGCEARFAKNRFTGSVYLSGENFGKPIAAKDPAEVASGDWFTLDVFAQGNRIIVKVNGKETTDFVDDDNLLKTGRIALKHGGNCKLEVRKADWQELKAIEVIAAKPPEPMPVAKGNFVPLFNGKDLDGWQPHAKRPGNWKVENGILIGSAPVGGSLYTRRADYRDFHLRAEVRLNDKGFGRIFCRAAYEPTKIPFKVLGYEVLLNQRPVGEKTGTLTARSTGHTSAIEAKDPPAPADWTVVDIIAVGDLVTVKVNGNITAEFRDSKGDFARSGHIALHQDANAVVEFRRVEIEDLSGRAEKK